MNLFKIPSKWTKRDFVWATWLARIDQDVDLGDVARDLERCVEFGFTHTREIGFNVDFAKYREKVESRSI